MKKETTSSGSAGAARGGSTRPDERKRKQGKAWPCPYINSVATNIAPLFPARKELFLTGNKPFLIRNKSFLTGNKSFLIRNKLFLTGNKPFLIRNKLFLTRNKPFLIRNKPFLIRNKSFLTGNKPFLIRNKSFLTGNKSFLVRKTFSLVGAGAPAPCRSGAPRAGYFCGSHHHIATLPHQCAGTAPLRRRAERQKIRAAGV
ncbi:MAG: hypothetical protein LBH72_05600 [Proteiniphilum sp.]|jgi:hypothetical protein|nr:hypothetical protein [Proteiniphilum sp.]